MFRVGSGELGGSGRSRLQTSNQRCEQASRSSRNYCASRFASNKFSRPHSCKQIRVQAGNHKLGLKEIVGECRQAIRDVIKRAG